MRARTVAAAVVALVVALALPAGTATSAAQTDRRERPRPDRSARPRANPSTVCTPTWPSALSAEASYYAVAVQLQNCQAADIPLSIDLGPFEQGTSLAAVGGIDAKGTGVVWDAGTGTRAPGPVTTIPKGDGIGGIGALVGFTTVPWWDGTRALAPGPYANTISTDGATNIQSMRGTWAVYLPSATFELDLQPPLPFPYVVQYWSDGTPDGKPPIPGAVFTGLLVTRNRPGGLQDPVFTTSSEQSLHGQSPPATSFVGGGCYDPVSLVNGANYGYANPSTWSFRALDPSNAKAWNFSPAANSYDPLDQWFAHPALMLVNGFVSTNHGLVGEVPLRDAINTPTSRTPHYLQIAVRNVAGIDCSGSDKVYDNPVAIGADLRGINLTSAQLPGAVLANTDLTGANLTQVSLAAGTGVTRPDLSYAKLSGTAATPTSAVGVDFEAARLVGADLRFMNLTRAGFKNTNLLLADLQGSTTAQANFSGASYCATTMPDGTINNQDCPTLKTPQVPWQVDTSGCGPLSCVYVSLYNNTTRLLAQGLSWCVDGSFATPQAPFWIAPLVTGQLGMRTTASTTGIKCGMTFANGAAGKVRVVADTTSGSVVATVDAGTCFGATADTCLPRAADGTSPVRLSTHQYVKDGATFVDVIVCEPAAYTTACPATAALPGL